MELASFVDAYLGPFCADHRALVRHPAETNRIDRFQRVPSDLRKYLEYTSRIKAEYGSVMRFVVKERLCWGDGDVQDLHPKGGPFEFDGMFCFALLCSSCQELIIGLDISSERSGSKS